VFLITIFIIIIATTTVGAVNFTIQTGYFSQPSNAQNLSQKLTQAGLEVFNYQEDNRHYVVVGNYDDYNSARDTLTKVKTIVKGAYIRKISFELTDKTSKESQEKEVSAENASKNDKQEEQSDKKQENNISEDNVNDTKKKNGSAKAENNKENEKEKVNRDLDYYKNNKKYQIQTAFLDKKINNTYQFSFPNGKQAEYVLDSVGKKIKAKQNYHLIFNQDSLKDIFPAKKEKEVFYTLQDFGFENNITLKGSNNSFKFNFPINTDKIKDKWYLTLDIKTSQFVDEKSSIDIYINEELIKSVNFSKSKNSYKINIPVGKNSFQKSEFEIKARLKSSGQNFDESNYENLWLKVMNTSGIEFVLKEKQIYDINNFLDTEAEKINLYYQGELSRVEFKDYIRLYTYLKRTFKNLPTQLELAMSAENTAFNNLNHRHRNIIFSEDYKETQLLTNMTLRLSPDDIEFIISDFINLINSNYLDVGQYNLKKAVNYKLSSFQTNDKQSTKKGWGEIDYNYRLPVNIFKDWPKDLNLHLTGSYFIPFNNPAYLKVYLNNKLVYSEELKNSSYFEDKLITIPGSELEQINNINIKFSQYPDELLNDYSNLMEVYLNPKSYFTYAGSINKENNFENLLFNFSGKGQFLIDENRSEQMLKTAALLYSSIHILDQSEHSFNIDYLSNYNFASPAQDINWYIVMGSENSNKINSKLQIKEDNIIIRDDKKQLTSFKTKGDLSYIDLTQLKNKPVMILDDNGNNNLMQNMVEDIFQKDKSSSLKGDLLIYNGQNYQTFDLTQETTPMVIEQYYNEFESIFNEYRRYFYLASVLLVVILLIWIYYRTSRHKENGN
jgi:hypothetical protein